MTLKHRRLCRARWVVAALLLVLLGAGDAQSPRQSRTASERFREETDAAPTIRLLQGSIGKKGKSKGYSYGGTGRYSIWNGDAGGRNRNDNNNNNNNRRGNSYTRGNVFTRGKGYSNGKTKKSKGPKGCKSKKSKSKSAKGDCGFRPWSRPQMTMMTGEMNMMTGDATMMMMNDSPTTRRPTGRPSRRPTMRRVRRLKNRA